MVEGEPADGLAFAAGGVAGEGVDDVDVELDAGVRVVEGEGDEVFGGVGADAEFFVEFAG